MNWFQAHFGSTTQRPVLLWGSCLAIQATAAIYFLIDSVDDMLADARNGISFGLAMECLVALALLLAVVVAAWLFLHSLELARRQHAALQVARGSMADLLSVRFEEWGLSRAEAEVALFTLKGCAISEIARLRNAAEGTVRSQLSQVYAKAGVSNQSMLVAQFIEDLFVTDE